MKLKIIRHKTLEDCMVKFIRTEGKISREDVLNSFMVGFDREGKKYEYKIADFCKTPGIKCWGFLRNKKEINLWVDADCPMADLTALVAHEYGHYLEPHYKSSKREEIKAGRYEAAARFAYNVASAPDFERLK